MEKEKVDLNIEKRKELFQKAFGNGSYEKWINVTKARMKNYYWKGDAPELAKEIVSDLMCKVISGQWVKNWDFEKLNLDQIMFMNIKGAISKYNKNLKKRQTTSDQYSEHIYETPGKTLEEMIEPKEEMEMDLKYDVDKVMSEFERYLRTDVECKDMLNGIRNNDFSYKDNQKISEKLKLPIPRVENMKKRFARKKNEFQKMGYQINNKPDDTAKKNIEKAPFGKSKYIKDENK